MENAGPRLLFPDAILNAIFVPDDVVALETGDQKIEIAIAVHIHQPEVVGRLVFIDEVFREVPFAVVLKPGSHPRILGYRDHIEICSGVNLTQAQH